MDHISFVVHTTDVITIDALKLFEKVVFCEAFLSSRRKYRGTSMFKTVSKPLAHLNFLSGVNCYDIGSTTVSRSIVSGFFVGKKKYPTECGKYPRFVLMVAVVEFDGRMTYRRKDHRLALLLVPYFCL